jgi:hypothetical protein
MNKKDILIFSFQEIEIIIGKIPIYALISN